MKARNKFLISLTAFFFLVISLFVSLLMPICFTANANAEGKYEVYQKIEGKNAGYSSSVPMNTDGLSITVSIDVQNAKFGYIGISSEPGVHGQPASSQKGIGILLYNSADKCLAVEVYSGKTWKQLTNTRELNSVSHLDKINLTLAKKDGVWGLYVNGVAFSAKAKGGIEGVEAGSDFNPIPYVAEEDFTDGTHSYIEAGTWADGGSITLYKRVFEGELTATDRYGETYKNLKVLSAYDINGKEISLFESNVNSNGRYSFSTLGDSEISYLSVETSGGVVRTVAIDGKDAIVGNDVSISCSTNGVSFKVMRSGKEITEDISVLRTESGYTFCDIEDNVTITAKKVGYESQTFTLNKGETGKAIVLTPKAFTVTVNALDVSTGAPVSLTSNSITVLKDGSEMSGVTISSNMGVTLINGLMGDIENVSAVITVDGYAEVSLPLTEENATSPLVVSLQKIYDAKITVVDEGGYMIPQAIVNYGKDITVNGGVWNVVGVSGDALITVSAQGYATKSLLITQNDNVKTVVLKRKENISLLTPDIQDGTEVTYTVNGLNVFTQTVVNGKISLNENVVSGDNISLSANGYYFEKSTFVLTSDKIQTVSAQRLYEISVTFKFNGSPVANALVSFDRTSATTDENGVITLQGITAGEMKVQSVQGYLSVVNGTLSVGSQTQFEVSLSDKIYTATITVYNFDGTIADEQKVVIGGANAKYENGVYLLSGLSGEKQVTVNGENIGTVSDSSSSLSFTLKNTPSHQGETNNETNGVAIYYVITVILGLITVGCVVTIILIKKK